MLLAGSYLLGFFSSFSTEEEKTTCQATLQLVLKKFLKAKGDSCLLLFSQLAKYSGEEWLKNSSRVLIRSLFAPSSLRSFHRS